MSRTRRKGGRKEAIFIQIGPRRKTLIKPRSSPNRLASKAPGSKRPIPDAEEPGREAFARLTVKQTYRQVPYTALVNRLSWSPVQVCRGCAEKICGRWNDGGVDRLMSMRSSNERGREGVRYTLSRSVRLVLRSEVKLRRGGAVEFGTKR